MNEENSVRKKRFPFIKIAVSVTGIAAACAAAFLIFVLPGQKKPAVNQIIVQGAVVFTTGQSFINDNPAKTGDTVKQSDVLKTGEKSALTVQFASSSVVSLGENALLKVDTLSKNGDKLQVLLDQKSGNTFNKIRKGSADYSVKFKTTIAAVRGTSFSVSLDDTAGKVRLLNGIVVVTDTNQADKTVELTPGNAVLSDEKGLHPVQSLNSPEIKYLEKLDSAFLLDKNPADAKDSSIQFPEKELKSLGINPVKMSLQEIAENVGPLNVILTYSGKKYVGAYSQKNGSMEITTVDGVVSVRSSQIRSISQYK